MPLVVDYSVSSPELPLTAAAAAVPEASVDLHRILVTGPDPPIFFVWVTTTRFDEFERAVAEDDTVRAVSVLESGDDQRLYRVTVCEAFLRLKAAFTDTGAAPDETRIAADGWHVRAYFPDRDSLVEFRDACRTHGVRFRLERLFGARGPADAGRSDGLSDKQREALELAHRAGYFEIPRRTTLAELANRLGVSKTAFSNRLRRATRGVVERTLAGEFRVSSTDDG